MEAIDSSLGWRAYLSYDQPILFSNFDDAVKYGKQLKNNPNLIKDREDKKY